MSQSSLRQPPDASTYPSPRAGSGGRHARKEIPMHNEKITEMPHHVLVTRLTAHSKIWGVDEFRRDDDNARDMAESVQELQAEIMRRLTT